MNGPRPRLTSLLAILLAALIACALGMGPGRAASLSPQSAPAAGDLRAVDDKRTPADAPLTASQLAKIQRFIDEKHRDAVIDPQMAKLLGLGKGGERVVAQQVSLVDKDKKARHIFDRLQDGSGFLVGKRTAEGLAVYRLDKDLASVANVMWRADGNKVALRSTDAAAGLRQEFELWARFADQRK
jgi:hypothetical protein